MRENEFRAWDEINNKWIDGCDLIMESSGRVWAGDVNNPPMIQIKNENVTFYTGLKDKNGKKIYEKDILTGVKDYKIKPLLVKWDDEECYYRLNINDYFDVKKLTKNNVKRAVVTGNIYENPEFLIKD